MPELGNKFECFSCHAKFYDLGRSEAICPKCGANQRDAKNQEQPSDSLHARRRRKEEVVRLPEVEEEVDLAAGADFVDEELVAPEGGDDGELDEEEDEEEDEV